jgi:hypothetical protein
VLGDISSIESYRRTLLFEQSGFSAAQIRQLGGGATQFSINAGNPLISASQFDLGAYVGDDWKVRPNLTLSLGLRYETQTNIHDWRDFAPRIGVAWAPGGGSAKSRPKNVIRAGFGMFYDRFGLGNTLTAQRYNGMIQQQYIIANPDFFPVVPAVASLSGPVPPSTIQQISSSLRAPYLMQSAVGFERQLPLNTTIAITYANSHGLHQLRSGVFPLGKPGQVFLMESAGLYNQNQLIVNVNTKVNQDLSLTGSYMYNHAMSNADGLGTFPANPYSMAGEYGPAATDMHHRVSFGGTITPKWGIRFNPMLTANSGPPFDITAGRDLYGDSLFNGRPGIAADSSKPGLVATKYGLLDPNPTSGEKLLSRNFGRGPGQISLNMRVGRTFAFGSTREGGAAAASGTGGGGPGGGGNRGAPASPFAMAGSGNQGGGGTSTNRRQPDDLDADPQSDQSQQPRPDHRQYHVAAIRPSQSTRGRGRAVFGERQQPATGVTDPVYVLRRSFNANHSSRSICRRNARRGRPGPVAIRPGDRRSHRAGCPVPSGFAQNRSG